MSQQAVPTFRDIQSMDDRELVRLTMLRAGVSCPKCRQMTTLEALTDTIREVERDEHKRSVTLVVHCSSCGTLPTPLQITLPCSEVAYRAMAQFGEKMKNFRPSAAAVAQANKIKMRRRIIDPTKPWYSEKDG